MTRFHSVTTSASEPYCTHSDDWADSITSPRSADPPPDEGAGTSAGTDAEGGGASGFLTAMDGDCLWDLAAGFRSPSLSPLDDMLVEARENPELRAALNLQAVNDLRKVLMQTPSTVGADDPVVLPARAAVLLAVMLLQRWR